MRVPFFFVLMKLCDLPQETHTPLTLVEFRRKHGLHKSWGPPDKFENI